MKTKITLLLLCIAIAGLQAQTGHHFSQASYTSAKEKNNKVRFYGGFGLSFSNQAFLVQFQPGLLYEASGQLHFGGGLYYSYYSNKSLSGTAKSHIYGGSLIGAFLPVNELEASLEFQYLFVNQTYLNNTTNRQIPSLYIGAGYRTRHMVIGFRYDVLFNEENSIYDSPFQPFVRIYF